MIEIEQEGNMYHVYKIDSNTKERVLVGSSLTFEGALAIERMMRWS